METLIIIFVAIVLIIGLYCVIIVSFDVYDEIKAKKQAKANKEEVVEKKEEIESTKEEDENGNVIFAAGTETLMEKYRTLSPEYKGYYDEIVKYAKGIKESKRFKKANYEEFRIGKRRFVRLKIRRGVIQCELMISNLTFKNYVSDNKVAVKQAPAVIKVTDEASVAAVKDSIEIAVRAIEEEKAYKKEQAKLRRKKQREEKAKDKVSTVTK